MKCLNLRDIEYNLSENHFDHFVRIDDVYLSSKIDSLEQIEFLKKMGIYAVIDLKSHHEGDFQDEKECSKMGLKYYNFPIDTFKRLKFTELQEFGAILSAHKGKILIYCISGNRAAGILALNSCLICGHPKRRAIEFGEKIGMENKKTKTEVSELIEKGRLP